MPLVSRTFDQLIDFSRTSAATYVDATGKIVTTPASRNLLTYTQEFDNGAWSKGNTNVTANSTTAPDGTLTADTLTAGSGAGAGQQVFQALTTIGAGSFVYSVYAKQGSGATDLNSFGVYNHTATTSYVAITVNYSTGVVTQTVGSGATMTDVGGGWWRIVMPFTSTATLGNSIRFFVSGSGAVDTPGEFMYAWGAQLELGSTASTYTRNVAGLFPPRFDYDPVTLAPKGLLVEDPRTNLLLRSNEFSTSPWSSSAGISLTSAATTSPDGTANGWLWTRSSTAASFTTQLSSKAASAITYTTSYYVKQSVGNFCAIRMQGSFPARADVIFNLSTGAIATAAATVGAFTGASATIQPAGNGWYRVTLSATSDTHTDIQSVVSFNSNGVAIDGTDSASNSAGFVYGAQLESGSFATSYIPTVASQVTRTIDIATIVAPNFAPWYNQAAGTFVVDAVTAQSSYATFTSNGNETDHLTVRYGPSGTAFLVVSASSTQANFGTTAASGKIAAAYRANDFAVSVNGAAVATDTSGSIPTVSQMRIGAAFLGGANINGYIRSIRYYPTRLTDAQLQALTA